jgi:hypothetical protein
MLALLCAAALLTFDSGLAIAKDGGSEGEGGGGSDDNDSGGGDSGGDSGGHSGDSGDSGNDNSGSGSDDDSDESGGSGNQGRSDNDHDDAREAVRKGEVIPLSKALEILKSRQAGRVIEVKLLSKNSTYNYRFKVVMQGGTVKTINMDAKTGRIRGFMGF